MKQVKFIITTVLFLFLIISITKQATASEYKTDSVKIQSYVTIMATCMLPDGTDGVLPDCEAAKSGRCNLGRYRLCAKVD